MDILTRLDAYAECEQAPLSALLADAADEIRMLRKDAERFGKMANRQIYWLPGRTLTHGSHGSSNTHWHS